MRQGMSTVVHSHEVVNVQVGIFLCGRQARVSEQVLNQPEIHQRLQLRATTSDGVVTGTTSTSSRLHLFGDVSVIAGLIGDGPTALSRITAIGNDLSLDPGIGNCGKAGQWVPVGVGQPTLRIGGLTVGGAAA